MSNVGLKLMYFFFSLPCFALEFEVKKKNPVYPYLYVFEMAVLAKLVIVLLRQISKPVSNQIKNAAKKKSYLHNGLARFGKLSFAMEHRLNLILGSSEPMQLLAKEVAVQRGADVLGESLVFGVAAVATITEYNSSAAKSAKKEAAKDKLMEDRHLALTASIAHLEKSVTDLTAKLAMSEAQVKVLIESKGRETQAT